MYLEIITGGPGSGKSGYIEEKIRSSVNIGRRAVVIVPERFSHIQEKTFCEVFGGLGQNMIEVITFSKLANKMLSHNRSLSSAGRQMLIMKAAKKNKDAGDGVFESACEKNGFISQLSSSISELKRSMISPEVLTEYSGGGLLENKMNAIGAIYSSYNDMLKNGFSDPDEDMERLSEAVIEGKVFENADVYIDGFSDFLPCHYSVISSIISTACSVLVSLMITESGLRSRDGIFTPVRNSIYNLTKLADNLNCELYNKHFDGEPQYINSPDISYFIKTYDEFNPTYKIPEAKNIRISILNDRHDEISWLAGRIMHEVRENGIRFRDIGVIVGDIESYAHIIEPVFSETGIPYFSDRKISAAEHPVIRLVLSIFRIISEDWSYKSVFEYLRSGFIFRKTEKGVFHISDSDTDILDIFVKTSGIRGKKQWLGEEVWKSKRNVIFDTNPKEAENKNIEYIDRIRKEYMLPFIKFMDTIKGKQRVRTLCAALFEFLEDIHLYEGLVYEKKKLESEGMLNDAAKLSAVWNCLIETLDQCVLTSGDEVMSRADFALMLEAGLSECSIDSVPTGIDCVNIADSSNNRPVRVKVLFAVGAVRGEFPKEISDGGLINDKERNELSINGFEGLPDVSDKNAVAEFNIYNSLTAATDRLYVSYPSINDDNTKNMYCALVSELTRTFCDISFDIPDKIEMYENMFTSHKSTYYKMLSMLVGNISEAEKEYWYEIAGHLKNNDKDLISTFKPYKTQTGRFDIFDMVDARESSIEDLVEKYKHPEYRIRPETAELLYGEKPLSITLMQMYNKCPFSHFVCYGLGIYPDEEYSLKKYELGQLIHKAIDDFCNKVQDGAITLDEKKQRWTMLDKEIADRIVDELIEDIEVKAKADNPHFGDEKIEMMCERAAISIKKSVDLIRESIVAGSFCACEFEKSFEFEIDKYGEKTKVQGKIDRIDLAKNDDGDVLLRVVDYKTGVQSFKISGICNKTDLQLILYALAAEDLYKNDNAKAAAVLYNKIKEELQNGEIGSESFQSNMMLEGIVITDNEPEETSADELKLHDKALENPKSKSNYLPLKTNIDGRLAKCKAAISREKFLAIKKYIEKTVIETKKSIFSGDISVYPIHKPNASICKYCGYEQICLFDLERDGERAQITSETEAWEIIMGGDDGNE